MPNWCYNELKITGSSKDTERVKQMVVKKVANCESNSNCVVDFGLLCAMPESLLGTDGVSDWRIENWGTEYNAASIAPPREGIDLIIPFDSEDVEPVHWFKSLAEKVQEEAINVELTLTFAEMGMNYGGCHRFTGGNLELNSNIFDSKDVAVFLGLQEETGIPCLDC